MHTLYTRTHKQHYHYTLLRMRNRGIIIRPHHAVIKASAYKLKHASRLFDTTVEARLSGMEIL